jgi:hypothetical protein
MAESFPGASFHSTAWATTVEMSTSPPKYRDRSPDEHQRRKKTGDEQMIRQKEKAEEIEGYGGGKGSRDKQK